MVLELCDNVVREGVPLALGQSFLQAATTTTGVWMAATTTVRR